MKNSLKAWVISAAIASMPLNVNAHNFGSDLKNQTKEEISIVLWEKEESMSLYIPPKVMTKAMLDYFDEEVKMYKLSLDARSQVISILNSYFDSHRIFVMNDDWRLDFVIDDKKEFSLMVKRLVSVIINDMPFLVRKLVIPLFLWWADAIQAKLDNLDVTLLNMKEKQYKDVMFDYVAWIVKRVAGSINGKITVWEYYEDISSYYPNKNWKHILEELNNSGQARQDIKFFKYKK